VRSTKRGGRARAVVVAPVAAEEAAGATTLEDRAPSWSDPGRRISPERVSAFIEFVFNNGPNPRDTEV